MQFISQSRGKEVRRLGLLELHGILRIVQRPDLRIECFVLVAWLYVVLVCSGEGVAIGE
jgi:hypothetical protein